MILHSPPGTDDRMATLQRLTKFVGKVCDVPQTKFSSGKIGDSPIKSDLKLGPQKQIGAESQS